ncbi:integrase arm-type DNA-binding domain-containing protein [Hyphomonas sp. GM-8P]|uniref:tyrosine-type recombinase/integrase n=1 Tax=Hyphomonas sp. GM-8P TaxID=1280945 RepID=UPI000DBF7CC5|nr:integrase arm-type DNA-binding domain-containing protein [Hyphomonas sp. GM-8P]RAN39783.1 hypothetical protein HY26_14720 [Hyphomonas sp. GM-8P]
MARMLNRLTANQIKAAKGKQMLPDGGGLYLQVTSDAGKSWLFRYRWKGKRPEIGLGPYPAVTLAEARRRADVARAALAEMPPLDPKVALRDTGEPSPAFADWAEEWLSTNLESFSNTKHRQQWRNTLRDYAQPLRDKPVDAIETEDVLACLQPIWADKRETARRVRGRIEKILDAAKAKGLREGENPARWRGHLDSLLLDQRKPVKHHAAMPWAEVPAFMRRLVASDALSAKALAFLVLTGVRSSEGRGALWAEIDKEARLWTIPPERMKEPREHRVPLSDAAMGILEGLDPALTGSHVFPAQRGDGCITETSLRKTMARYGGGDFTLHGFRSAFRDWAGENTAFPREVAELALAHAVGNAVERAYRRGDALEKRRALMQAWSDHCLGEATGKVVRLHG